VITTALKVKPKPSLQTQFMLNAISYMTKHEEERWAKKQASIDLLRSTVDSQGETQQQMVVQMDITS
jgi:hypothetical protein